MANLSGDRCLRRPQNNQVTLTFSNMTLTYKREGKVKRAQKAEAMRENVYG